MQHEANNNMIIMIIIVIIAKHLKTSAKSERRETAADGRNRELAFARPFLVDAARYAKIRSDAEMEEVEEVARRSSEVRERERIEKKRVTGSGYCERKPRGTISTHHRQLGRCS